MASWITGSGNSIDSRSTGAFSSQMVSPVATLRRPTTAAMSPAQSSLTSSRLLACILRSRPMRSLRPAGRKKDVVAGLHRPRVDPDVGQMADKRVAHDLEDQRREGRVVGRLANGDRVVPGSTPSIAGTSSGDGKKSTTPSSSGWTPLLPERRAAQHRGDS